MHTLRHAAFIVFFCAASLMAQVPGILRTSGDGREIRGLVRWLPVQKQYSIAITQTTGQVVNMTLSPEQVADIRVQPPAGWDEIVKNIREGRAAQSTARLEAIIKEYAMLQYDVAAGMYLAQIHLRAKQPAEALRVAELVIANKPDAGTASDLAPFYWEALMATGKTARLGPALDEAIQTAPRPVAARAHTLRGDLLKSQNQPRDALKDGYLRTITLFADVRAAQPEALFKAALAFEELQQVQYAERMRQLLLSRYADSEYAKRLRGD